MNDISITGYIDYRDRLETDAEEFRVLFNTILINVTGFFRDTEAWTYLKGEIIPDLLAHRDAERGDPGVERGLLQRRGSLLAGHHLR